MPETIMLKQLKVQMTSLIKSFENRRLLQLLAKNHNFSNFCQYQKSHTFKKKTKTKKVKSKSRPIKINNPDSYFVHLAFASDLFCDDEERRFYVQKLLCNIHKKNDKKNGK